MTTVLADVADALGLSVKTVAATLNRANFADVVFEMTVRFRVPQRDAAVHFGISEEEFRSAALRASHRHRRAMRDQQQYVEERRAGVVRGKNDPVGEPPEPGWLWCRRDRHWVHPDEVGPSSGRSSGKADWCRACFRKYWAERVKAKRARAAAKAAP